MFKVIDGTFADSEWNPAKGDDGGDRMKRKVLILAALTMLLSFVTYGTIAYFTASRQVRNVVTTGDIKVALLEWADDGMTVPFKPGPGGRVMPGLRKIQIVQAENTGTRDAYVRMRVECSVTPPGRSEIKNPEFLTMDWNSADWKDGGDGFFYYKHVVKPGERTTPLYKKFSIDKSVDNTYKKSEISVSVTLHGVQADHNGEGALTAAGWPVG